jgi:ribosomal protein S18 acetylase RimI-like enzyme
VSDLAWRVEQACHNAWPDLRDIVVGDWLVRGAENVSRRANSANPLRPGARLGPAEIDACEGAYRRWGQPSIFRLPSMLDPAIDARLEDRNYVIDGQTLTLLAPATALKAAAAADVEVRSRPTREWLKAKAVMNPMAPAEALSYGRILKRLAVPAAFAALRLDGQPAALAFAARHEGLLCLESVVTHERHRGQGLGRRMLAALFASTIARGCEACCLQVRAENAPAIALYRSLGFETELYRYHYRREPG